MHTSLHAQTRISERMNLSSDRMAELAKERGIRYEETTGKLKKYLDFLYSNDQSGYYIVFNNQIFVYTKDFEVLITVLPLPSWFNKDIKKIKEKRSRKCTSTNP